MIFRIAPVFLLLLLFGCDPKATQAPGVCISFDDRSVDEWFALRPLFNKYNAKVTFFVTQFDSLSEKEINELKILQQDGHEIGSHGMLHVVSENYIREYSYDEYLDHEVDPSIEWMTENGFEPRSFAYPYGAKYWFTDFLLLKRFKSLRSVARVDKSAPFSNADEIFCVKRNENTFSAASIDGDQVDMNMFKEALDRAMSNNEVLMLYGHEPVDGAAGKYQVSTKLLENMLKEASSRNLTFYTFRELTSDK